MVAELWFPILCDGGAAHQLDGAPHPQTLAVSEPESPGLFLPGLFSTCTLSLSLSLRFQAQSVFLTLTTCFKSNLPSKPLTHLKISKSPHNLFRRPGNWAAYNFLDSHHPSPQSPALFSAGQLLVLSRLWICLSQRMVCHGHSPHKAVWTPHAETKVRPYYRFA